MKKGLLCTVLIMLAVGLPPARMAWAQTQCDTGHAYMCGNQFENYQVMAAEVPGELDLALKGLWLGGSPPMWQTIIGQAGPGWVNTDHGATRAPAWAYTGTGVRDDYHWAFLEEVLNPASCLSGLPFPRVLAIRNYYRDNRNRTLDQELTVNQVRIRSGTVIWVSIDETVNVTTCSVLCVDVPIVGNTCFNVPCMFKDDPELGTGLLNDTDSPKLRNLLVNMNAAYLTIGDSRCADYWYSFIGRVAVVFINDLLPGLIGKGDDPGVTVNEDGSILIDGQGMAPTDAIRYGLTVGMSYAVATAGLDDGKQDKAPCPPWGNVNGVDVTINNVDVVGWIRITVPDTRVCEAVTNFAGKFTCGATFNCSANTFLASKADQGDLKQDASWNIDTYNVAGGNLHNWLLAEGARLNFFISAQPAGPAPPITYNQQHTFGVTASSPSPVTYQWFSGPDEASLQPIQFAVGQQYTATFNFYSFEGQTNQRVYRVRVGTDCDGQVTTIWSTPITVTGVTPPPINISAHPSGGNFLPGQNATLSVTASVDFGGPLQYQWQKWDGSDWTNLPGRTASTLSFSPVNIANAGQYRCVISNVVAGKGDEKANPVYWAFTNPATLNVAPEIVIVDQPVGAELNIGDDYQLLVTATVAEGTLEYRWQRNTGFGFQFISSWATEGAGGNVYDLIDAQINDAGAYRCVVRNTHPLGQYARNSASAVVSVSSGTVLRVDPTAPGAQTGLTWEDAFHTIQAAIDAAAAELNGGEVWVAGGPLGTPIVYNELRTEAWGNVPVQGSLIMKNNVGVYGGFEGYRGGAGTQEESRLERVRVQNVAVIDGSVARGGLPAYHTVVFGSAAGATVNAVLDGFVITGGNAAGEAGDYHTWRGGGIYNWQSSPTILNCYITGNFAAVSGGGIANESGPAGDANAILMNCLVVGNTADRQADTAENPIRGGGGIFNNHASPTMTFVTVSGNTLGTPGYTTYGAVSGGMYVWDGSPVLNSSIVWGNPAGGIQVEKPLNSLEGITVTYSDVQGGVWPGTGNISQDPLLGPDATLTAGSPAIDAGDINIAGGDDIAGVLRPLDGGTGLAIVDMGAREYTRFGPTPACIDGAIDIAGATSFDDWLDFFDGENSTSEAPIWYGELEVKTFGCADLGWSTIDLTVYDILGRSGTCTADVWVYETEAPVAACDAITVSLDGSGSYTLTVTDLAALGAASTDNCAINWSASSAAPNTFSCLQAGAAVSVTLTVVDSQGNSSQCVGTVNVVDDEDPVAACGAIDVNLNASGFYTLMASDIQALGAASTDNCSLNWALATAVPNAFSCADIGPNVVTLTVVDASGNTDTCTDAVVNVFDVDAGFISGTFDRNFITTGADYSEAQALQGVSAEDVCDGDITASVVVAATDEDDNPVPFPIPANYDTGGVYPYYFTLTYTAADSGSNVATATATLMLFARALPEITLNGDAVITLECKDTYIDPGATAWDPEPPGMDLTPNLIVINPVNTDIPNTYTVTYRVQMPGYNIFVEEYRTVHVLDTIAPTLALIGPAVLGWEQGVSPFVDPGVTAVDLCAGDLAGAVIVTGSVDVNTPGDYLLTYNVSDGFNSAVAVQRQVKVGTLVQITRHPAGARLYTTDDPYNMEANYINGIDTSGHEWFRELTGLGVEPPETGGNTVVLAIDPSVHPLGSFNYRLKVYDDVGETVSSPAVIEVAAPLTVVGGLTNKSLQEGATDTWSISVGGGLGALQHQWYADYDGSKTMVPIADGPFGAGAYAGASTATLQFAPFTKAMAGQYEVEVSDDFTSITVGPATLAFDVGVPAFGLLGLLGLAAATALGGATALRRRK